jgi:peptide deformylase
MIRHTIQIGNELLRTKSQEVSKDFAQSKEFKTLKTDLIDTLRQRPYGVAISAIQISEPYQVFVIEIKERPGRNDIVKMGPICFINPKITFFSKDKSKSLEGCISIFDSQFFGEVERSEKITFEYFNEDFEKVIENYEGLLARIVQHEIDHFHGILFSDLVDPKTITTLDEYRKLNSRKKQA